MYFFYDVEQIENEYRENYRKECVCKMTELQSYIIIS